MKRLPIYLMTAVLATTFSAANAGDVDALMKGCNDCHGPGGVSTSSDVPSLAGFPEFVHSDALYMYRDNERPCAESKYRHGDTSRPAISMCGVAAKLSDDDIDALAAAYAELPYVKMKQDFDATLAAAGKAIHDEHCDKCHSEAGTNPDDEAGMMGGQPMGYLRSSFKEFAADARSQPKKMKEKFDMLSEADLEALAHYYGSIQ
ncbi:MAG: cytochrome c-553 [Gammaproteobacteria bacterium]|nr:cytochrome c-553 [Gammaproteobacteria bacterium]MBT8109111.1 cytochrome c-553 [Gammaproteobacteria bacterium]NNL43814.1 cytochrome c-553 [Woeseiaceae bacterium]